jgi:tripartite-type tricarboxylate transporter receptor subunit TctC
MNRRLACLRAVTFAAIALSHSALSAQADHYPNRPIRMIVPNAPGSSVDLLSRLIAVKLGELMGQQVVVDNRAGAGGMVGMEMGKNASPDGYTLLSAPTAATTIAPLLHKKAPYDPVNDYAFISNFAVTPNVLVVTTTLPIKSVRELVDYAKTKQGQLNMASAGPGSQSHLTGVYFMSVAGIQSLHVPYKGGGASVASVVAGESHWTLTPAPAVMSLVKGGRLRAIGHTLPQRSALLGEIPPIAETLPGFDYSGWLGVLAPKGTPSAIVEMVRDALVKIGGMAEVREALALQASEVQTNTPAEFRRQVQDAVTKNSAVVKTVGLKIE